MAAEVSTKGAPRRCWSLLLAAGGGGQGSVALHDGFLLAPANSRGAWPQNVEPFVLQVLSNCFCQATVYPKIATPDSTAVPVLGRLLLNGRLPIISITEEKSLA